MEIIIYFHTQIHTFILRHRKEWKLRTAHSAGKPLASIHTHNNPIIALTLRVPDQVAVVDVDLWTTVADLQVAVGIQGEAVLRLTFPAI